MAKAAVAEYREQEGIVASKDGKLKMEENLVGVDARLEPLFQLLGNF